jgi:hypothetical protein
MILEKDLVKKEVLEAFRFARLSKFPKKNLKIKEVYAKKL